MVSGMEYPEMGMQSARVSRRGLLWSAAGLVLAACGPAQATPATSGGPTPVATPAATPAASPVASPVASPRAGTASPAGPGTPGAATKLTIGLGYIPDVQFAPFYVAKEKGYYRDEGLEVDFRQGFETDVLKLVGTGALSFGVVSGDELLVARSQQVPVVYVAAWFQKYPVTVVAREEAGIRRAEDLRGHSVGVPGRFGATYVGLRALLLSAGLQETDVRIQDVGFNQVSALTQKQVDAVVGYTNNEPIQLRNLGQPITAINVFDRVQLVSNGLVTDEKTLQGRPDLVRAVVRAMLRGLGDTIARPDEAVEITIAKYVPEAAGKRDLLRQVLDASIPLWQGQATQQHGLGYSDPADWTASLDLLRKLNVLGGDVDLSKAYTNSFIPTGR
jgi:NitT/TauT family transport system substrate-binding protein